MKCWWLLLLLSCAAPRSRDWLRDDVQRRTALTLGTADGGVVPGVSFDDGLDADEAASVALWKSPALQAELTQLETALATLDEANRPANPRINNILAPLDPRQLALSLFIPLESIWQMPFRISAATAELESTADSLVQVMLDTERTVRAAHADAVLAEKRIVVLQRVSGSWKEAVALAENRAASGDIAPLEADQIRAELTLAEDLVQRAEHEARIARGRLATLLNEPTLPALVEHQPVTDAGPLEALQRLALDQRPELRAAALSVNATAARAQWERSRVFSIFLSIDGQAPVGSTTMHFAPGAQFEIPLFSQNQGGIGRADAAVVRASYRYAQTRLAVLQDVLIARESLERARLSQAAARRISGFVASSAQVARQTFANGNDSYLVVIDALRRTTDAQVRELETDAEAIRAEAELWRAVGGRHLEVER